MKIIKQSEIEEAADLYTNIHLRLLVPEAEITNTIQDLYDYCINDFKSGVEFAESKFEDILIEFLTWYACSDIQNRKLQNGLPQMGQNFKIQQCFKEIVNIFITERDGK